MTGSGGLSPPASMRKPNRAVRPGKSERNKNHRPFRNLLSSPSFRAATSYELSHPYHQAAAAHCGGSSAARRTAVAVDATPRKARRQMLVAAPRGIGGMAGPAGPAHGEPSASDGGTAADNAEGRDGRRVVPDGDRRVALVHVARRNHASQIHHDSKKAHCRLWTGDPGQHSPHTPYHPEAAMASSWHGSRHGPAMPPQVVTRGRWEGGREKK